MSTSEFDQTEQTRLRRHPERGTYDQATIYEILDEGLVCHIGFAVEGQSYAIPTTYCRVDDQLFIHGATASRMLKSLSAGLNLCLTVTLLDGLVVARSAFNNSMNYRSAVVLGTALPVEDLAQKYAAMQALVEHILPGRWHEARLPSEKEVRATSILALPISRASAKIRAGQTKDDEEDYALPLWAGLLPLQTQALAPVADEGLPAGLTVPSYLTDYQRGRPKL